MNVGPTEGDAIRKLYPTLSEGELKEAEANLRRYFEIAREIQRDQELLVPPRAVDNPASSFKIKERSNIRLTK